MSVRYWYQDEWLILVLLGFVGFFGHAFYAQQIERSTPEITPSLTGRLLQPLFGPPSLELTVWLQHPAALQNVRLFVMVNEDPARGQDQWIKREHSFESWPPNQDQAMTFAFPLQQYDPEREIAVSVILVGKSIKLSVHRAAWLGSGWKPEP